MPIVEDTFNPLPTNDAYMRHEHISVMSSHMPIRIFYGGLILGVNTLHRLFCFFKLFPMVGKGVSKHMDTDLFNSLVQHLEEFNL